MKDNRDFDTWRMVGMVSAMGFEIFAFIIGGALVGSYAGTRFGSRQLWLPLCAVAGFLFGIFSCFMTLRSFIKK
ncbi:hypothetical protein EWH99_05940 [Sporolactobacillus sp. THM7-7]|nr:hypothetical protein EWH99_05940 [Sporolactobacillus sp. THM7-7]